MEDIKAKEWLNNNELSYTIWDKKYRNNEESFDDWLHRISDGYEPIMKLIKEKKFIFGGRILANRGVTDRKVTYSNCFTGSTKIMTSEGLKSLISLYNSKDKKIKVLSNSSWRDARVEFFGEQSIVKLILQRNKTIREFEVTQNHQWYVKNGSTFILKSTSELNEGDVIPKEVLKCYRKYKPNCFGVAHGFFMGDGDHSDKHGMRVNICKGKEELLPYYTPDTLGQSNGTITINGMPKLFLKYPELTESKSYLYGWLAGYFAADGSIDERGSCVLCSTKIEDLIYVQNLLCVLGIPCENIRKQERLSNLTGNLGTVYILNLNKEYLNPSFFIREKHRKRFLERPFKRNAEWKVKAIVDLHITKPVYCAIVDDTHSFALEGGIKTHNCYVMIPPEDNLESIFDCAKRLARTYSYGGGCGVNISKLAPKGAIIHNAAKETSGAISFMDFYSYVTGLIGQSGRRGALMISLDCHHPDLEDFINLKTQADVCTKANISVMVTDDFMRAVINNDDWVMRYYRPESNQSINKIAKAQDLFMLLAKRNWEWAEPGILYWDTIQSYNMLSNTGFKYAGVNPCAEQPLPAGGSCLLGSINLSEFVVNPFNSGYIDYDELEYTVAHAIVGLNQVLMEGMSLHPLQEQRETVKHLRQIGLGTMGLADMLIKLGITYGSEESIKCINEVYYFIAKTAVETSLQLARKSGCYPACVKDKLVDSPFIKNLKLSQDDLDDIRRYGLFNSQLLTCAPTGSIGTMLQTSTGVEPIFAMKYTRKTQSLEGKDTYYDVYTQIAADYLADYETNKLPDYFVESKDIDPIDRIKVQSAIQKYTDASISSTINLPKEATVEDVYNIYIEAWVHGLKGVTVYRQGCNREGVLTTEKPKEIPSTNAPKRPKVLEADCYSIKSKGEQFIVLVGLLNNKPYEIFAVRPTNNITFEQHKGIITKETKMHYSFKSDVMSLDNIQNLMESSEEKAATLYSSMLLRHGVDIKYIIKTAKKLNTNISSFSSAMCRILAKYIPAEVTGEKCPECGGNIINEGGCKHCDSCSYSKCE
jgi:ribonucleoside-diphosphate reductase alpha chain